MALTLTRLCRTRWSLLAGVSAVSLACSAAAQETIQLDEIVVEGDAGVVTEGSGVYTTERVTVGGRQPQRIRDVPQTVTVLTRQVLDDSAANTIEEASRILPGLTNATGDGFAGSLYARGQEVFQYYVDGAQRPYLSIYGTAPDLFFFDRMEVMYGPSGVYQGSGEPVGTLNLVRKRAPVEPMAGFGVSGDTLGGYRVEGEVGGAFNEAGTFRARAAAYSQHREGTVDFSNEDDYGFYGTVEADITDSTTISVGGLYDRVDTLRHSGLPTFTDGTLLDVDRDTFIGSTENDAEIPTFELFAEIEHGFDYGGVLKATGRYFDREASLRNLLSLSAVDPATGGFTPFWFAREFDQEAYFADINLTSPLDLGVPVELTVGADFRRDEQTTLQQFDFSPAPSTLATFDARAFPLPTFTFPGVGPGFLLNTDVTTEEFGLYAQARIEITPELKLNIGGRYSDYSSRAVDTGRGLVRSDIDETNFAPYVGVTWDVADQITLYASYSSIFQPQSELDATGANLRPRKGDQFEGGVKAEFFDGDLQAQASVYQIEDRNRAIPDTANVGAFIASGNAKTRGVELYVTGSPTPGLELTAGYIHVDTDLTSDPTPRHNFGVFGKYSWDGGMLDGFSLGGGMRATSSFDNDDGGVTIDAPGYVVFDAFASYQVTDNVKAQLNVYNLFDRKYIERVNTLARGTFFGQPLTAQFSVKATF